MYDIYRYIFIGGLVLSLVFLATTVFLFFFLNIREAMGEITGSSKRKALERAKEVKNQKSPTVVPKPVAANAEESQETSRLSVQDRYNAMGQPPHPSAGDLNAANNVAQAPVSAPGPGVQTEKKQTPNCYKPITIKDPDFVLEADISFVHSNEVIA